MAYFRCTGNSGGSLKLHTASGAIATFTTNIVDLLQEVKCSINPIQDLHGEDKPYPAGGGKNKFGGNLTFTACAYNNDVMVNTRTDTRTYFAPVVLWYHNGSLVNQVFMSQITQSGHYSQTFNVNKALIDKVTFGHNGSVQDIKISVDIAETDNTFTISFDVTNCNPTTVGGLSVKNIQMEVGSEETSYAPYSNVCPIVGYSELNLTRCGKNLFKPRGLDESRNGLTLTYNGDGTYTIDGTATAQTDFFLFTNAEYPRTQIKALCFPSTFDTTLSAFYVNTDNDTWYNVGLGMSFYIDGKTNALVRINAGSHIDNLVIKPMFSQTLTDTYDDFEPYNGQTIMLAFGQTVYGGVLDVTRGKLKPCIEYPSYNGETLSGRWLSSEATYVEGTTPPTGSQVVSLDDYGADIDLTPVQIRALVGENNVFADCGETEVEYLEVE